MTSPGPRSRSRSPLVVDTRDLGRRPGASHRISRTVPAPADLGSEVIGVEAGSPVALDLLLEAVMEGVLVSGTASGTVVGECVRCLDPVSAPFTVRLQELFAYDGAASADDEDVRVMDGDRIDLDPAVRDALVPTLPFQPVCRDDCPGLPTRYGVQEDEVELDAEEVDPRWAALARLAAAPGAPGAPPRP